MSGATARRRILEILRSPGWTTALKTLRGASSRGVIASLFSALCNADPHVKWRAVEAMGMVVADLATKDMEAARDVMRRLMWSLNDESGAIGWGAPEAMGEIMARHQGLAGEFAAILVSYTRSDGNFIEYKPLQRGAIWGIGRLARVEPDLVRSLNAVGPLISCLSSCDAEVRGLAAWALGALIAHEAGAKIEKLLKDKSEFLVWTNGELSPVRVSEVARNALSRIERGSR